MVSNRADGQTPVPAGLHSGTAGFADRMTLPLVAPLFVPPFFAHSDFEQSIPAQYVDPEMRPVTPAEIRLTALNKL